MGRKIANVSELKNILYLYYEDKNHHAFGQDGLLSYIFLKITADSQIFDKF